MARIIHHWIGGKPTSPAGQRSGPVFNPATGEQQAQVAFASTADVDEAVRTAKAAFEEWSQASLSTRTKIMFAFRELVNARINDLAGIVSDEHGKVVSDARGEVQRGLEVVEFACGIPQLLKGDYSDQVSAGGDVFSFREPPRGVAGSTPFNFPVLVSVWMHPRPAASGETLLPQ